MPELFSYDYAIVRVVPRVEREEFLNAGVILSCESLGVLTARIELDRALLSAFAPSADGDLIEQHLASIPRICAGGPDAGPLGRMTRRERFHWLTAVRSSTIQTSPAHSGQTTDTTATLERLMRCSVRRSVRR